MQIRQQDRSGGVVSSGDAKVTPETHLWAVIGLQEVNLESARQKYKEVVE